MHQNDDQALEDVFNEIQRNQQLKDTMVQASRSQDFENVAQLLGLILNKIGRTVDNFVNFVNQAIEWFMNW